MSSYLERNHEGLGEHGDAKTSSSVPFRLTMGAAMNSTPNRPTHTARRHLITSPLFLVIATALVVATLWLPRQAAAQDACVDDMRRRMWVGECNTGFNNALVEDADLLALYGLDCIVSINDLVASTPDDELDTLFADYKGSGCWRKRISSSAPTAATTCAARTGATSSSGWVGTT